MSSGIHVSDLMKSISQWPMAVKNLLLTLCAFVIGVIVAIMLFSFFPVSGVQSDAIILAPEELQGDLFVLETSPLMIVEGAITANEDFMKEYMHRVEMRDRSTLFSIASFGKVTGGELVQENRRVLQSLFIELGSFYGQRVFSDRFAGMAFRSVGDVYRVIAWDRVMLIALISSVVGGLAQLLLQNVLRLGQREGDVHSTENASKDLRWKSDIRDREIDVVKETHVPESLSREAHEDRATDPHERLAPLSRLLEGHKDLEETDGIYEEMHEGWTHDHWEEMGDVSDEGQPTQNHDIDVHDGEKSAQTITSLSAILPTLEPGENEMIVKEGGDTVELEAALASDVTNVVDEQPQSTREDMQDVHGDNPRVSALLANLPKDKKMDTQASLTKTSHATRSAPGNLPIVDPALLDAFGVENSIREESDFVSKSVVDDLRGSAEAFDMESRVTDNRSSMPKHVDFESAQSQQLIESDVQKEEASSIPSVRDTERGVPEPSNEELKERLNKLLRGEL